jgi:hypothetical protein
VVEVGRTGARFGSARNRDRWTDVEPDVTHREPEEPEPDQNEPDEHELALDVGRTGARFGSSRARWRHDPAEEEPDESLLTQALPMPPKPAPPPPPVYDDLAFDDLDGDEEPSSLVRPYARTGGRTESSRELRLETLISVRNPDVVLVMEHRRIVELCEQTRSVAEVAAALPAPLGVARVLIDDLIELGVLTVFTGDSRPDEVLLSRVLAGLRRL